MTTNGPKKTSRESMLVIDDIQKLVTMLDKSGLHELEVEIGGTKVRLAKPAPAAVHAAPSQVVHMAPMHPAPHPHIVAPMAPAAPASEGAPAASPAAPTRSATAVELKSPMVGTFYRAPAPGAEPFAKVGDRVKKGQVLCIIEAMKLMNEIESEMDGVIVDILAENAQPVEYGEALMNLEPA